MIERETIISMLAQFELDQMSIDDKKYHLLVHYSSQEDFDEDTFDLQVDELVLDPKHHEVYLSGLRGEYIGAKNEYLLQKLRSYLDKEISVSGEAEELNCCACCRFRTLSTKSEHEICPVCLWEDDGSENLGSDRLSNCNGLSLIEARHTYERIGVIDEKMLKYKIVGVEEKFIKC